MGRKGFQGKWFYSFSLEDRVPEDHLMHAAANAQGVEGRPWNRRESCP